jgi:hypothetical protein
VTGPQNKIFIKNQLTLLAIACFQLLLKKFVFSEPTDEEENGYLTQLNQLQPRYILQHWLYSRITWFFFLLILDFDYTSYRFRN